MSIKINFICDIDSVLSDYIRHINNKRLLTVYFGEKFDNNNINNCVYNNLNERIINKIVECIGIAQYFLDRELSKENRELLIDNYEWKICVGKDGFMFDYPFTLEDVIFLPMSYINESDIKMLSKTLFHEYIHISQRKIPGKWDKHIDNVSKTKYNINWKKIKNIKHSNLNDVIIWNPDTYYNDNFVIENDDIYYKGYLILGDDNKFQTKWFEFDGNKFIPTKSIYKYEHPYEMLAYLLSNCVDKKDI